jgi:hypothetical protein
MSGTWNLPDAERAAVVKNPFGAVLVLPGCVFDIEECFVKSNRSVDIVD